MIRFSNVTDVRTRVTKVRLGVKNADSVSGPSAIQVTKIGSVS